MRLLRALGVILLFCFMLWIGEKMGVEPSTTQWGEPLLGPAGKALGGWVSQFLLH